MKSEARGAMKRNFVGGNSHASCLPIGDDLSLLSLSPKSLFCVSVNTYDFPIAFGPGVDNFASDDDGAHVVTCPEGGDEITQLGIDFKRERAIECARPAQEREAPDSVLGLELKSLRGVHRFVSLIDAASPSSCSGRMHIVRFLTLASRSTRAWTPTSAIAGKCFP